MTLLRYFFCTDYLVWYNIYLFMENRWCY